MCGTIWTRHGSTPVVLDHLRQRRRGDRPIAPHREHEPVAVAERVRRVEDLDRPAAERDPAPRSPSSAWPARSTPARPGRSRPTTPAPAALYQASFLAVVCVPLPVWAARPVAAHSAATPSAHSARRFLPPPGWTEGRANVSARPSCAAIWAVFRRSSVQRGRWLPSSQAARSSMSRCRRSNKSELASAAAEWLPTRCASAARRGAWDWSWGRLAWPWSAFRGAARVTGPGDRRAACKAGFPPCRPAGGDRGVQQGRRGATARQPPVFSARRSRDRLVPSG